MNKGFVVALATLIGFSAGTFAGSWMQRTQPVPAPPAVSYVRHRVWIVCLECKRSASLDRR